MARGEPSSLCLASSPSDSRPAVLNVDLESTRPGDGAASCAGARYPPIVNRTANSSPATSEYAANGSSVFARK
jgi:hypothetical protein